MGKLNWLAPPKEFEVRIGGARHQYTGEYFHHQGEEADTCNFVSHLLVALERNKIRAFVDLSLERGLEIGPAINKAIEQSRSAIVVISQTYASSPWCLEELDKILECKEKKGQLVFLIFGDVDPREMRNQSGRFKRIGQSEKSFGLEHADKVRRWRDALRKAGNLTGWSLGNRLEAEFIQSVVEKIARRLNCSHPDLLAFHPVGLDSQVQALYSLLQLEAKEVRIVGISGTSGIGRTTLVRALYYRIADQFDRSCFLAKVKDISSQEGLHKMQETLLGGLLGNGDSEFGNDLHEVINLMRSKLHNKRVLLVFDNVEGLLEPLSHLIKSMNFGLGSRVILIPRHEENLIGLCRDIYEVRALNDDQALELFSRNAFQESKSVKEWQRAFDRLKEIPQGKGTVIEGIKLDNVDIEDLISNANSFKKMKKLRLFMIADLAPQCGPAGHLSGKLWRRFARNSNNMLARCETLVKQISEFWCRRA
ncbi:disease resistance protein RUN1-like [Eucalyptus grandis]|uniref:disease resistance protein RUN1-like n=1 Tax=Eucalyptus grandis TaxID=71139 RepID=UPI00192E9962|nr:disease resistance protein RUN1-like [Eucalyptus grandis]